MSTKGKLAWAFIIVLAILHYDFWYWDDKSFVFGFLPIGLAYQAGISLLAGIGWFMVASFAWPSAVEEWADSGDSGEGSGS